MLYVWLGVTGLLLAATVIFRGRDPIALSLFWVGGAIVFTANYLVLDLTEMYHYRPGLLPGLIPDTVLGVFLAELAFVGGFTVWVVRSMPLWSGLAFGTAVVVVLELLFRRWQIFIGHSWTIWHTALTFPVYFALVYWFQAAAERSGVGAGWVRTFVRVHIALWWTHFAGMVAYWIMAGLLFQVRWLPTFARNQALGALLTVAPWMTAATVWVIAGRGRARAFRLAAATAGLFLMGWLFISVGLWRFRAPWSLYLHTFAQAVTIFVAALCDDWIGLWSNAEVKAK